MPVLGESTFEKAVSKVMREQDISRESATKIVGAAEAKKTAKFATLEQCIKANTGIEDDPKGYCLMKFPELRSGNVKAIDKSQASGYPKDQKRQRLKKTGFHSLMNTKLASIDKLRLKALKIHANQFKNAMLEGDDEVFLKDLLSELKGDRVTETREKLTEKLIQRQDIAQRRVENPKSEILKQELEQKDQDVTWMIEDILRMDKEEKIGIPLGNTFIGKLTAKLLVTAFDESKHPRDEGGEFTSGGEGGSKKDEEKPPKRKFSFGKKTRDRFDDMSESEQINILMDVSGYTENEAKEVAETSVFSNLQITDQENIAKEFDKDTESDVTSDLSGDEPKPLPDLNKPVGIKGLSDTDPDFTKPATKAEKAENKRVNAAKNVWDKSSEKERVNVLMNIEGLEDEKGIARNIARGEFHDLNRPFRNKLVKSIEDKQKTGKFYGRLQTGSLVDEFTTSVGDRYVSYFLLNDTINLKGWGVTAKSIPENVQTFKNMPFVITSSKFFADSPYGETTDHPSTEHFEDLGIKVGRDIQPEKNDMMLQAKFQEKFRVGNIDEIISTKDGNYMAFIKIDPKFANYQMPPLVSPAIFQLNPMEPVDHIKTWVGMHLAGLDERPAYGNYAIYKGSCNGNKGTCLTQLSASLPKFNQLLPPCTMKKIFNARLKVASMKLAQLLDAAQVSSDHPQIQIQNVHKKKIGEKDRFGRKNYGGGPGSGPRPHAEKRGREIINERRAESIKQRMKQERKKFLKNNPDKA